MKVKSVKGVKKSLPVFLVFKSVITIIFLSFLPLTTAFRGKKGHGQKCLFILSQTLIKHLLTTKS
jgi:hypothetical protein